MVKDVVYHLLHNGAQSGRILMVHFDVGKDVGMPKASLFSIARRLFEEGVATSRIVPVAQQLALPPWLRQFEGVNLEEQDGLRAKAKLSNRERVENRLLHITSAVRIIESILSDQDPQAEINRRAAQCNPPQHPSRFRLWLLTYLCFGRDMWALLPPFHRSGHWNRERYPDRKFGAPSLAHGKHYGHGSSREMTEACIKSYRKRAQLGKPMATIYAEAMVEDFHCRVITHESGMKSYVQFQGEPFPTYWQFRYRVVKAFGKEMIQKLRYGSVRYRTRIAESRGRFSEEVSNLMERVEADGFYVKERPKGYVEGTNLPPLCVVVSRDVLSGMKLGIGFSFGAERATAYRMMLFCMAIPKNYFCRLFGVPFVPGEWPNQGLPGHFGIDRGPWARKELIEAMEKRFPIRDMAPSWSGQSKATVESSHPKDLKFEGKPTYVQSELTPVELAKREIIRLIQFNNGADMEARFDPDRDLAYVAPSPVGLWNYYDERFRNDGQPMRVDEAIRTFLTPIEFLVREDGVYLDGRRYSSEEFEATGTLERCGISQGMHSRVQGYVLDMCVRHVWIEVDGRLLELDAKLRIRGDEETLWMSIAELDQWAEARRAVNSAYRAHQHANTSDYRQRFEQSTGKSWEAGQRKSGKPKRASNFNAAGTSSSGKRRSA
ncbi:hypothetical protein [Noviherbaspirillum cavernae]|uniref:hypothetical protein n=1 Tax=Noviherbaspirillum cavernae TaxID=2320862 RepID=UPI0018F45557|nr:hypothetical protein [Noviherbaspirillum cavernae]